MAAGIKCGNRPRRQQRTAKRGGFTSGSPPAATKNWPGRRQPEKQEQETRVAIGWSPKVLTTVHELFEIETTHNVPRSYKRVRGELDRRQKGGLKKKTKRQETSHHSGHQEHKGYTEALLRQ